MKTILTILSFSIISIHSMALGTWSQKAVCPGSTRYRAASFVIGGKCYMGTGSMGSVNNLKDFWEYDAVANSWTQMADLAGTKRTNATSAGAGNYGYVGLGSDNGTLLTDWWQFDPVANTWQAKAAFPGVPRFGAEAFSLQDLIYAGGGLDSASHPQSDFYVYDPVADTWTIKASLPIGVSSPATFTLNQKGYFIGGALNGSVTATTQNIEYDPVNNTWTTKAPYAGGNTFSAIGFALDGYGYMGTGFTGSLTDMMWRYDPHTNTWSQETPFPTGTRQWAVSCVIGDKAYVGTGNSTGGNLYHDWWEFTSGVTGIKTNPDENVLRVYYDANLQEIIIKNARVNQAIRIYDAEGRLIFENVINSATQHFSWNDVGIFIVAMTNGETMKTQKIICIR